MDLSEEALYWGSKQVDGNLRAGTRFSSADSALKKWGQPTEDGWPYAPDRDDSQPYPAIAAAGGDDWFTGALRRVPVTVESLAGEIRAKRSVIVGLLLTGAFHESVNGRIAAPIDGEQRLGKHAVLVVGYNAVGGNVAEFVIRNSWGTGWGDKGYGYLPIGWLRNMRQAWVID